MGEWLDKVKGKIKEVTGAAAGDRSLEADGKKDLAKGHVKEGIEDVKHGIKDALHSDADDSVNRS